MTMITDAVGDILDDGADALVNPVNLGGVMGRGLPLAFKRRFPDMFRAHERMARRGELALGRAHVWETGEAAPRFVVNLAIRRHWRSKVARADLERGLEDLARVVAEHGITSIAVPALGCGRGGLGWSEVRPMLDGALAPLPDVEVRLYPPGRAPAEGTSEPVRRPALTPGRAALLALVDRYAAAAPEVTVLEVQRLAYFLQEAGQDLRLHFARGPHGPLADDLRHVLAPVEGVFVTGYGDGSRPTATTDVVELVPGVARDAARVVASSPTSARRVERVAALARGFESPYGLELLAVAHWSATRDDGSPVDGPELLSEVVAAGSGRPDRMFTPGHAWTAVARLVDEGWFGPRRPVSASSRA